MTLRGPILDVTVDGIRGLDPGLSATVVTVAVTVETASGDGGSAVAAVLAEVVGVEVYDNRSP